MTTISSNNTYTALQPYYTSNEISYLLDTGNRSFGYHKKGASKGVFAEQVIGGLLNLYANDLGYYVFHSVATPNNKSEIDHVVLSGNHIILCETKAYDRYESLQVINGYLTGVLDGQEKKLEDSSLNKKLELFTHHFTEYTVLGLLCVPYNTKVRNNKNSAYRVANLLTLEREIQKHVTKTSHTVSRPMVAKIASLCVSL